MRLWRTTVLAALLMGVTVAASAGDVRTQTKLAQALHGTGASGLVLDWQTGTVVAQVGDNPRAVPGSVIKPLLLEWALQHGVVRPETTVYCRRTLRIGTRELRCTHPADQPLIDAEMALAESCNTWFAEMGKRYAGAALDDAMAGLHHAEFRSATVEQRELAALGLQGVTVTPSELAKAYRELLLPMKPGDTVAAGLRDSVSFGMARGAKVPGMEVMGKTGTASEPGQPATHGWFAGAVPGRWIVVIFVPRGDGGVASGLAQTFLESAR